MIYRDGNYSAFYVDEPFSPSNLGANATPDFVYYNLLKSWKGADSSFPFVDSHDKTYNVRDGSDWESTLKPRLHERLNNSKNIILFLSSITRNSRALKEEMCYGIINKKLPVIVIYPDYKEYSQMIDHKGNLKEEIKLLWDKLPSFKNYMYLVPTLHIPLKKEKIRLALEDKRFMINTKIQADYYWQKALLSEILEAC